MITKEDKELILNIFKQVDVKKMEIEHEEPRIVKWFRFGSYNGMQVASEIIKNLPEHQPDVRVKKINVT
jgi:hypothetical protein